MTSKPTRPATRTPVYDAGSLAPGSTGLLVGMYVRVPLDTDRSDADYRDFRIGKVRQVDEVSNTVTLTFKPHPADPLAMRATNEWPLALAHRCAILPGAKCERISTREHGEVLQRCGDELPPGQYCDYYVRFAEKILRVPEADLTVRPTNQDPDPFEQLRRYEFHSPVWRFGRDEIIEAYGQLRNATFGIEDLVGSRIMLLAHQAEVVARVLGDVRCRYVLADEVGLGKTIEACVILKGLRRRHPDMQTLVIAPGALVQQWRNELSDKFWLEFAVLQRGHEANYQHDPARYAGAIVSVEDVASDGKFAAHLGKKQWGLLIVDEAHHLGKSAQLHQFICSLSRNSERALILTATPIQRRADEYLALLRLMDPARYMAQDPARFRQLVAAQNAIRHTSAYVVSDLTAERFVPEEFLAAMQELLALLPSDTVLTDLVGRVAAQSPEQSLGAAQEVLAYIKENYRIEKRVIRNRRAQLALQLPARTLDASYAYSPSDEEGEALDILYEYVERHLAAAAGDPCTGEFCRAVLHAAYSSPHALLQVLDWRRAALEAVPTRPHPPGAELARPAAPREEAERVRRLAGAVSLVADEQHLLDRVLWRVSAWRDRSDDVLRTAEATPAFLKRDSGDRLGQALRAIYSTLNEQRHSKVLVFSAWPQTLAALHGPITRSYGKEMVAQFQAGCSDDQLQEAADRFQVSDRCGVLLCDELGGEGRNFQMATHIVHLDLPWTPAQLEQRIGRVDRLGRSGEVCSIPLVARDQPEQDLFNLWHEALHLFTHSMSGLEIALEGIQDDLMACLCQSVRGGLGELLPRMVAYATKLRDEVEEERYFEEEAVDHRLRDQFNDVSQRYRDGARLRRSFLPWASLAGLAPRSDDFGDVFSFSPSDFQFKSMENARFFAPPNMEEALRRSRHRRDYIITGTFSRDLAVRREDLVFLVPGSDPWTDAIVGNAIQSDRGRCCAVFRRAPELGAKWQGFELLYSLSIDARPLYEAGFDPSHLFRAQGYLQLATYRIIVTPGGEVVDQLSNPIAAVLRRRWDKSRDVHLGRRDLPNRQIDAFKRSYPEEQWEAALERVRAAAGRALDDTLAFTDEIAEEVYDEFARRAAGWRAASRWLHAHGVGDPETDAASIAQYERISKALVEGIRHPLRRLESVCFWYLEAGVSR